MQRFSGLLIAVACVLGSYVGAVQGGTTLDAVTKRGFVQCGVSQGIPGFSNLDDQGNWQGIDVDSCRGVASAVFGDAGKAKFMPLSAKERFTVLQSGEIDMLPRNTTWTLNRDAGLGLAFVGINYHDGQGFMVRKSFGVRSALELNGATVCAGAGTTTELNLADYFRTHKMKYTVVTFEKADEVAAAYDSGRCDVYTSDQSQLHAQRIKLKSPDEHVVLPEVISKEPLGPVVRHGDDQWFDIVKWSLFCMINAEELDISSTEVAVMMTSDSPKIRRLLGVEGDLGKGLGLSKDWCRNIIEQVGNYGESFARNLGSNTPLKIERGLNTLWSHGGIMYAPPLR